MDRPEDVPLLLPDSAFPRWPGYVLYRCGPGEAARMLPRVFGFDPEWPPETVWGFVASIAPDGFERRCWVMQKPFAQQQAKWDAEGRGFRPSDPARYMAEELEAKIMQARLGVQDSVSRDVRTGLPRREA